MSLSTRPIPVLVALGRAIATALLAGGLLVGIPTVLVGFVGNPLPEGIPTWDHAWFALTTGQIDGQTWVKALALVAWAAWGNLAAGFAVELVAAARGRRAMTVRGLRVAQLLAARVLTQWTLAGSLAVGSATAAAGAAPPPAVAAAVPVVDTAPTPARPVGARRAQPPVEIEVGRRDTLWALAETHLGDGQRWEELRSANVGRAMPDGTVLDAAFTRLRPGWRLVVPADESARYVPEADVEVAPGDHLWRLSEDRLEEQLTLPPDGEVAAYVALVVERNDPIIDDPDLIYPGQVLTFPQLGEPPAPNGASDASTDAGSARSDPDRDLTEAGTPRPEPAPVPGSAGSSGSAGSAGSSGSAGSMPPVLGSSAVPDDAGRSAGLAELGRPAGLVLLGAAGGVLGAGALQALGRRRRYRRAHRAPRTVPSPPGPELGAIERALRAEADPATGGWLRAALAMLADRPIWDGEEVGQPVLARLLDDHLEIELSQPDPVAVPLAWSSPDRGHHWRLDRGTPLGGESASAPHPAPTMVTVGAGTLLNLEGMGVLGIRGTGDGPQALVRSIVHELATSPAAGTIDVRSTFPIEGVGGYQLVQEQTADDLVAELVPWLTDTAGQLQRQLATSAYAHRLQHPDEPIGPVVIVTDRAGLDRIAPVGDYAAERWLPVAVVAVDAEVETGFSIEIDAAEATVRPWDLTIDVQGLTARSAEQLGQLLVQASSATEEPVTAGNSSPAASARDEGEGDPAVVIRVLGEVSARGVSRALTPQQLSLLCFLAWNGPASRSAIVNALWGGRSISSSRFLNVLAETRARVGRNHMPEARDGRYELRGVTTDLAQFERAVAAARELDRPAAAARLRAALDLVRGVPFTLPAPRFWPWVGDPAQHTDRVEPVVADTALELARIELELGDAAGARWACEQGRRASPTDEALVIQLIELHLAMGRSGLARRLVDDWEDQISRLECGEPSAEPRRRLAACA